jgi:hypothetical protein
VESRDVRVTLVIADGVVIVNVPKFSNWSMITASYLKVWIENPPEALGFVE